MEMTEVDPKIPSKMEIAAVLVIIKLRHNPPFVSIEFTSYSDQKRIKLLQKCAKEIVSA